MKNRNPRGFTLLETVVALAILAMALMAIFDLNSGAVANHVYTKHLTVAAFLARAKMTDLEQKLYDDGFNADDDEESGDFSEEGWPNYKWRAKIIAPKTDGVTPDQLIGAIFNLPIGGDGDMGGIASLFGGGAGGDGKSGGPAPAAGGMAGMAAGMAQPMFTQMIEQLKSSVREVHLTVTWREGKQVESMDVVTHVVSLGPGSDRNGGAAAAQAAARGVQPPETSNQWVNQRTGLTVPNPIPGPNGQMLDPVTREPLVNRQQQLDQLNSGQIPGGGLNVPGGGGGIFNPRGKTTQ